MTKKISELPVLAVLPSTALFEVTNGTTSQSVTASVINTFVNASVPATPLPWSDIRSFGSIVDNNITTALQATITSIGAAGKNKTIMIPELETGTLTQDTITLPSPTGGSPGWTLLYFCNAISFTVTLSLPIGTVLRGAYGGSNNVNNVGAQGPEGTKITGISMSAGQPVILVDGLAGNNFIGTVRIENVSIDASAGASYAIKLFRTSNILIRDCYLAGGSTISGAHAALAGEQPGLLIDGCFWVTTENCVIHCGDGEALGAAALAVQIISTDSDNVEGANLLAFKNIVTAHGSVSIGPIVNGSGNNGQFSFVDWCSESLDDDQHMLIVDGSETHIFNVYVENAQMADPVGDAQLLRFIGQTGVPSIHGIRIVNSIVTISGTGKVRGLEIGGLNRGVTQEAGPLDIPVNMMDYGASWCDAVDQKLIAAPRTSQWILGTVQNVAQDGSDWDDGPGIAGTSGFLAPDGSLNAVQVTGTATNDITMFQSQNATWTVGDWFIAGVWAQAVNGSRLGHPADGVTAAIDIYYGGFNNGSFEGSNFTDLALGDVQYEDEAWHWMCGAVRISAVTNGGVGELRFYGQLNDNTVRFFNPCLQYIPNSAGIPDADVINYARSLKGGWSPTAVQGDLNILDTHRFCGGAIRTPLSATKTIASGVITVTGGYHKVDTQAAAATDDLDTINGGKDGMRLVIRAANNSRTVVVKDGTGNIQSAGDFSLDNIQDTIELIFASDQSAWLEVGRSDNGA